VIGDTDMKVTVYVPEALKARMDGAGELNWSALAQRAFEAELNLQEWKMEPDMVEKAVARLRASKAEGDAKLEAEGRAAGQDWARRMASFRDLKAVAEYDWPVDADATRMNLMEMVGGGEADPDEPGWFDDAWIEGFIAGATEVWEEVADKI
jgi:hypothetical protein